MKKNIPFTIFMLSSLAALIPMTVRAHCPLCVGAAGAAAGIAAALGVSYGTIGVFIGAFAIALGLWTPRFIKKEFFTYQRPIIVLAVYLLTLLPLLPLFNDYTSLYVNIAGDYGSLLNRTYLIHRFAVGATIGTVVVLVAPWISKQLSALRNGRFIRFQGMIITFALLIIAAIVMQGF